MFGRKFSLLCRAMQLFFKNKLSVGDSILLDVDEAKHAVKVLRIRIGESIHITDGRGNLFHGTLQINGRDCLARIESVEAYPPTPFNLHLAVAPTKNRERLEWFVEKAVEIGVGKITLLQCEHSEKILVKLDRLERIAISAMKQSTRFFLPEISGAKKFEDFINEDFTGMKSIAHCNPNYTRPLLKSSIVSGNNVLVCIGPEGDFSKKEIELAVKNGFQSASLGNARLRTETAALMAVATFEIINQRK